MQRSLHYPIKRSLHAFNGVSRSVTTRHSVKASCYIQSRSSTAFDPWHYLHQDTVRRDQNNSFRSVWNDNIGDFKQNLSAEEIELFEERVSHSESFDDFYLKMRELFSPRRHDAIRQTRTWEVTHNAILSYLNDSDTSTGAGLCTIIFASDEEFSDAFGSIYLSNNDLVRDFALSDLRFMCALQAIDIYGGPQLTAVFGCRNHYHFNLPDPSGHSAHWLTCLYSDRVCLHDIVLLCVVNAVKENKAINQLWFRDTLDSLEPSAIKDEEWREYAKEFSMMDTETFNDKLDRAFLAFQTDAGVAELEPRFNKSDI